MRKGVSSNTSSSHPITCLLQVLQDATALGRYVSAPLFALILGFAMSTVHILPTDSSAYDTVWAWLMPLATALYLLDSADLRQ